MDHNTKNKPFNLHSISKNYNDEKGGLNDDISLNVEPIIMTLLRFLF